MLGEVTGALIDFELDLKFVVSHGFFSVPPAWAFLARNEKRYGDLAGPEVGHVMSQLDWHYTGLPVCVMALDRSREVVAMGWAGRSSRRGGAGGVNLSYGVAPEFEGRGLALLTTSLALLEEAAGGDVPTDARVHAQFDVSNLRSGAVAARLGLQADRSLCVDCRIPARAGRPAKVRSFMGASGPWSAVLERARQVAEGQDTISWDEYAARSRPRIRET